MHTRSGRALAKCESQTKKKKEKPSRRRGAPTVSPCEELRANVVPLWEIYSDHTYPLDLVLAALVGDETADRDQFRLLDKREKRVVAWCEAAAECNLPYCENQRDGGEYVEEEQSGEEEEDDEEEDDEEDVEEKDDEEETEDEHQTEVEEEDNVSQNYLPGKQGSNARPACLRGRLDSSHRSHCLCGEGISDLCVLQHVPSGRVFFVGNLCARKFAHNPPAVPARRPQKTVPPPPSPAVPARRSQKTVPPPPSPTVPARRSRKTVPPPSPIVPARRSRKTVPPPSPAVPARKRRRVPTPSLPLAESVRQLAERAEDTATIRQLGLVLQTLGLLGQALVQAAESG